MNKISAYRKTANLTQVEFANMINITQGALGHYESGRRIPSIKKAHQIVDGFNKYGIQCTVDDVFPSPSK